MFLNISLIVIISNANYALYLPVQAQVQPNFKEKNHNLL